MSSVAQIQPLLIKFGNSQYFTIIHHQLPSFTISEHFFHECSQTFQRGPTALMKQPSVKISG